MGTIANAKVTHYYNCYNGDFIGCLLKKELPTDFLPAALLIFYLSNPIGLKHHCLSANHTCHSTRYGNNKFQNHIPRFLHKDYPLSD